MSLCFLSRQLLKQGEERFSGIYTMPCKTLNPHHSIMDPMITYLILGVLALYLLYKRATRITLDDIPGPEPESFWLGTHTSMSPMLGA